MNARTLAIANKKEETAFKTVFWGIALCLVMYGIFAFWMVFDTVDRSNFEKEMKTLYSNVGKLEGEYIAQTRTISLSFAHKNGFDDAPKVKFTTRNTVVGIRSDLHNEI